VVDLQSDRTTGRAPLPGAVVEEEEDDADAGRTSHLHPLEVERKPSGDSLVMPTGLAGSQRPTGVDPASPDKRYTVSFGMAPDDDGIDGVPGPMDTVIDALSKDKSMHAMLSGRDDQGDHPPTIPFLPPGARKKTLRRQRTVLLSQTFTEWWLKFKEFTFGAQDPLAAPKTPSVLITLGTDENDAWIDSAQSSIVFGALIIVNCIVIGVETDLMSKENEAIFIALECAFLAIFSAEIGMRARSEKARFLKDSWNWFDMVVIGLGLLGLIISFANFAVDGVDATEQGAARDLTNFGPALRVLRLLRLIRIFRLVRLFRELYLLVNGIANAARALFWVAMLTTLVILVSAIFITRTLGQGKALEYAYYGECRDDSRFYTRPLTDVELVELMGKPELYSEHESPKLACSLLNWFGTVPNSMFSLFGVMTLEGWPDMARTTMKAKSGGSVFISFFYIFFVFFTNITLLNLVTGVIVENVLLIAHQDEIDQLRQERKKRGKITQTLNEIFLRADVDGSFSLSRAEFKAMLVDPEVLVLLRTLDINIWDAEDLFDILDVDDSGSMDIKEFFEGFSRVKGTAHGKHLLKLHYDLVRQISVFQEHCTTTTALIGHRMGSLKTDLLQNFTDIAEVLRAELAPDLDLWNPPSGSTDTLPAPSELPGQAPFDMISPPAGSPPPEKPMQLPRDDSQLMGRWAEPTKRTDGGRMARSEEHASIRETARIVEELDEKWQQIERAFQDKI
jgi:voltage-gated sodium channel